MEREEAIGWLKVISTREFAWDDFALQESQREIRERCEQGVREAIDMAIEALSDRPTDEWCTDCKEYDHEKHCCPRFNRVIRTTLNEALANLKEEFESAEYEDYEHATLVDIKEPLKVLVVLCKDCRHAEHRKQMQNQVYCKRDKLSTFCAVRDDDDFCKYGERSNNE